MAKVLVVDDSPSIRALISGLLESMGHIPLLAEDGQKALELANAETVDLIVTDLNMPRLGGIGLITALRSRRKYANTPILVLTTELALQKAAMQAGATGFGVKPLDEGRFRKAIDRLIG